MTDLSIVILHYRTPALLFNCLTSLLSNPFTAGTSEIWVVDNASGDGTPARVRREFPHVQVLVNEANLGFAAGNNRGVARSAGRYILLLNPDTEVHPGALDALVAFMERHPGAGAAGAQLIGLDGEVQSSCRRFPNFLGVILRGTPLHRLFPRHPSLRRYLMEDCDRMQTREVDWILGACMLIRRQAWQEVGPLDEGFFMYYEDIDWCYRAHEAGWKIYYVPEARITHHHRRESAHGLFNRLTWVHIRSIMRLFRKHPLPLW